MHFIHRLSARRPSHSSRSHGDRRPPPGQQQHFVSRTEATTIRGNSSAQTPMHWLARHCQLHPRWPARVSQRQELYRHYHWRFSGYCEVEDLDSGERFQVMRSHCSGLQRKVSFRCSEVPYFASFRADAHAVVKKAYAKGFSLPYVANNSQRSSRDGIVMVVYPTVLASAYASIQVIRDVLGCRLPIEIWFHVDEIGKNFAMLASLQRLATQCPIHERMGPCPRSSQSTTATLTGC